MAIHNIQFGLLEYDPELYETSIIQEYPIGNQSRAEIARTQFINIEFRDKYTQVRSRQSYLIIPNCCESKTRGFHLKLIDLPNSSNDITRSNQITSSVSQKLNSRLYFVEPDKLMSTPQYRDPLSGQSVMLLDYLQLL